MGLGETWIGQFECVGSQIRYGNVELAGAIITGDIGQG
jgi:hypothetical protein